MSFLAAALGVLGGFGSSALSGLMSESSAVRAARIQREIARENRDWMERMSNTAHQREVDDLRAAGLNPILSAGALSGASTPSAATDVQRQPVKWNFENPTRGALGTLQTAAQIDNTKQNTDLQQAQEMQSQAQAQEAYSAASLNQARMATEVHEATIRSAQAKYAHEKEFYGKEIAGANWRKSEALADEALANTLYRLSPEGHSAYRAERWFNAIKGVGFNTYLPYRGFMLKHINDAEDSEKRKHLPNPHASPGNQSWRSQSVFGWR